MGAEMTLAPNIAPPTFLRQFAFKFNGLRAFFGLFLYRGGYI